MKTFDLKMRQANRNVCLTLDNFAGHEIAYQPTNVKIVFFEPNLTPFVQPLDAGVIRCFKAHYRQALCQRALNLDDAGEQDIYKINLAEAMFAAKDAWQSITSETIRNCWDHTGIQRAPIKTIMLRVPPSSLPRNDSNDPNSDRATHTTAAAWDILEEFAMSDMTLPQAEDALKGHLGDQYIDENWRPALNAVMAAEKDATAALESIKALRQCPSNPTAPASLPATVLPLHAPTTQCADLEADLMSSIRELKSRNRIFGHLPTIEELINPPEERENESLQIFDSDDEIVHQVHYEKALEQGEIVEISSEDEEEDDASQVMTTEALEMCKKLGSFCLDTGVGSASELSKVLHRFRAEVSREYMKSLKQSTLVDLWGK